MSCPNQTERQSSMFSAVGYVNLLMGANLVLTTAIMSHIGGARLSADEPVRKMFEEFAEHARAVILELTDPSSTKEEEYEFLDVLTGDVEAISVLLHEDAPPFAHQARELTALLIIATQTGEVDMQAAGIVYRALLDCAPRADQLLHHVFD